MWSRHLKTLNNTSGQKITTKTNHQRKLDLSHLQSKTTKKLNKQLFTINSKESESDIMQQGIITSTTLSPLQKIYKQQQQQEKRQRQRQRQGRLNSKQFDNHGVRHKNKKLTNNSRNIVSRRRQINLMYHEDDEENLRQMMNLNDTDTVLQITEQRIRGGSLMNNFVAMSKTEFNNDNSILVSNGLISTGATTTGHFYFL